MTGALVIDGLVSGYGHSVVVRGVTMDVQPGEVVALLGRNGAGKTTLLSTVAGLIRPMSGTVTLDGTPLKAGDPIAVVERGVGYVPESRSLFTQLTVRDNLVVAGAHRKRQVDAAIANFPELGRLLDRRAGMLSGGEQQMLAIARALVLHPRVLLVDELSLGLAPVICRRLVDILRDASRNDGVSVLLVEQHIYMALDAADRAYVLRRGEISHAGSAAELHDDLERVHAAYLPDTLPDEAADSPTPASVDSVDGLPLTGGTP
jgi:branched-chain amino acid transport system ATP-binding protein